MPRINSCVNCGTITESAHLNRVRKFCGAECRRKYAEKNRQRICEKCGNIFAVDYPASTQRFCSHECFGDYRQKHSFQFICQTCGKEFIDTHNAYRGAKFCGLECYYKSLKEREYIKRKRTWECKECGRKFQGEEKKYCSKECLYKARSNNANPNKKIIYTCKHCGKEFLDWKYRNKIYCSRQCQNTSIAKCPKPSLKKPESFVERSCKICGNKFKIHQCQLTRDRGMGSYCSNDCRGQALSFNRRGENNTNWKGGAPSYRGPNWNRQARKARKRDNYICQVCQKSGKNDHARIEVHHIIPYRLFDGDYESANQLSNLISLCAPCHHSVEYGRTTLPDIKEHLEASQV